MIVIDWSIFAPYTDNLFVLIKKTKNKIDLIQTQISIINVSTFPVKKINACLYIQIFFLPATRLSKIATRNQKVIQTLFSKNSQAYLCMYNISIVVKC